MVAVYAVYAACVPGDGYGARWRSSSARSAAWGFWVQSGVDIHLLNYAEALPEVEQ